MLLIDPGFPSDSLFGVGTDTIEEEVPIAGTTLDKFVALPTSQRTSLARSAADALPPNTVAHRLGDFLFINGAAQVSTANAPLWVILFWPDPDRNDPLQPSDQIIVGQSDGNVLPISYGQFPVILQLQNQLREILGLPPLPDLSQVTHADPAVAESTD
ncbi:MAG: hypothetical protein ACE5GE_10240 [Phycisphaerae bacterium]